MIWPDPTDVGDVYEPAEDSDLLAGVVADGVGPGDTVLDVGTGSGYVAGAAAAAGARVVASDLNPHACRTARERYGPGGSRLGSDSDGDTTPDDRSGDPPAVRPVDVVRANLVDPFRAGAFDAVAFNPPYLPTAEDDRREDWMARALSGGPTGRAVIEQFLDDVGRVLAPGGVVYLLVSTLSGVEEVAEAAGEAGFSAVAVREESYPFETLTVLKLLGA